MFFWNSLAFSMISWTWSSKYSHQIKHNSQLLCCCYFFKLTVLATDKEVQSRFLSFAWTLRWSVALVPAEAPCAHPPPQRVHKNLGNSLLIPRSPIYWLMTLSFIWQYITCTCPPPSWKILGRFCSVERQSGLPQLKDTGQVLFCTYRINTYKYFLKWKLKEILS